MATTTISMTLVALLSTMTVTSCGSKSKTDSVGETMEVSVAYPVEDTVVRRLNSPGYLEADKSIDVVARVNGFVTGKHFKDGDKVKKGQILFTIEDSQYRDLVAQATAQLESAKSASDYASRQYKAMKQALESDAVSQMDVIQSENAMNEALASIKSAQAALQTAQTNLGYCSIRALSDGHIAAPNVEVGDYVSGGAAPVKLTTIYDDSSVKALISIEDAQYLDLVDKSNSGEIDFAHIPVSFNDTLPHSYFGRLDYLAPSVDKSTGTMTLKVKIDNPYGELKNGMFVNVDFPLSAPTKALLVKDASLSTDQLGRYLYVVNDSNKVVYTPVTVGELYGDSMRVVTRGLNRDDRYVTKALLKVKNGMIVKPIDEK